MQVDEHFPGALVIGSAPLATGLDLPNPCDCHVLAAAILGRVNVLVAAVPQSLDYISPRPRSGRNQCKHIFVGLTL